MINLLPYEHKSEIRAARTNTVLLRYIMILAIAFIVLGALAVGAYIVLFQTEQNAKARVEENQNKVKQYVALDRKATEFRSNLATAKSILDNDTNYSTLVYSIADAVPSGVVLDTLTLDASTLGTETQLNANAKTYDDAIRLKDSFAARRDLFEDVKFNNVSGNAGDNDPYPIKVTLGIIIKKEAMK